MRRLSGPVLVLVLVAAGCGGGGSKAPTATTPSAEQVVRQTAEKTGALETFHFAFDTKNPAASTSGLNLTSGEGDVKVPDRLDASVAGTLSGVSLTSEVVFAGEQQFLKNPLTGEWQRFDTATSPVAYFDPAKGVLAVVEQARNLKLDGSETVDGVDCYRLTGTVSARDVAKFLATKPSDRSVDVELYVGKDDLLLREVRVLGPVASGEPSDIERDVRLSRFDEPVSIEAPTAG